jgi:hypothetical protein
MTINMNNHYMRQNQKILRNLKIQMFLKMVLKENL